ncbi:TrmB family transcriptional regulator [Candidatus Woesearchaeota archaeon]|nr:TrmB family transcriptional regulator [Candidatus Woesearchaeota archaeon]
MNTQKLLQIGLSNYEAKCYKALFVHGNLFGKDIAEKSEVPPTSVYRNLETLQSKGFVQVIQKQPLLYQAVSPEIAISSFVKKQKQQLEILQEEAVAELKSIETKNIIEKREEILEVYAGREQSYSLGKKLITTAKKEFLMIGKGSKQSIIELIHSLDKAVKRGVICKFLVTNQNENRKLLKQLKAKGVSIKYYPLQDFSLLIMDRLESQIVIKNKSLKEERIALKIKSKELSVSHAEYFNTIWKKAVLI